MGEMGADFGRYFGAGWNPAASVVDGQRRWVPVCAGATMKGAR